MRRAIVFGVVAALILTLSVLFVATRERDPIVFAVEPGTATTFSADELIPGDRFSCHGGILPRQGPGYAADASDGTYIGTDTQGNVTVRCPEEREPV